MEAWRMMHLSLSLCMYVCVCECLCMGVCPCVCTTRWECTAKASKLIKNRNTACYQEPLKDFVWEERSHLKRSLLSLLRANSLLTCSPCTTFRAIWETQSITHNNTIYTGHLEQLQGKRRACKSQGCILLLATHKVIIEEYPKAVSSALPSAARTHYSNQAFIATTQYLSPVIDPFTPLPCRRSQGTQWTEQTKKVGFCECSKKQSICNSQTDFLSKTISRPQASGLSIMLNYSFSSRESEGHDFFVT